MAEGRGENTAGLKPPWPKGFCPNPGGRPSGPSLTRVVFAIVNGDDLSEFPPVLVQVARAHIDKCIEGDSKHTDMTWNRMDGKVPDRVIQDVQLVKVKRGIRQPEDD